MEYREVTDIYLNAYLLSKDFKYVDVKVVQKDGRNVVVFMFEDSDELKEIVADYYNNEFIEKFIDRYLFTKRVITKTLRRA